ncbi:dethiobiotin synthase [Endozoicomonas sp. OPT23]|uniref:dethiobiotin synthase n=1 Tax=Endozoicomonas sp. OPT23 TaxID=2072845 RepID=UPI00129BA5AA|nr:dethiobiotin synthase [Endozoicomonas sp. OPT23]MRI31717.1 dethiobiotin synthase [Endozoicomonas sp. OPT23]
MAKTFFITGTDTDAGKTFITCGLLEAANQKGLQTLALKPVAAGSEETEDGPKNEDAIKLMASMSIELPYAQVNPVLFEPAIAPHIAAQEESRLVTVSRLTGICRGALMKKHDVSFIEGAGGWRVPLNDREMLADLAKELNTPVILVVGMKLGCISHALLTAESIVRSSCRLVGWVANQVDPEMNRFDENVETLKSMLSAPCLGVVKWKEGADSQWTGNQLDITSLL